MFYVFFLVRSWVNRNCLGAPRFVPEISQNVFEVSGKCPGNSTHVAQGRKKYININFLGVLEADLDQNLSE